MAKWFIALGVLFLALVCVSTAALADAPQPPPPVRPYLQPQTLVRLPDGRRYNMVCMGRGGPTAILDGSLSQWSMAFRTIQPELAKATRVCAVDRAGFGFSDPGPFPRDAAAEVSDLEAALKAAKIAGPYILVGHSLGGNEMRLFAYRHPEQVVGLLLIDPGIEHFKERLRYPESYYSSGRDFYAACAEQARAGKLIAGYVRPGDEGPCLPKPHAKRTRAEKERLIWLFSRPAYFEAIVSELDSYFGRTSDEVDAARHKLGSVPLIILTSDKAHFTEDRPAGMDPDALYSAYIAAHEDQARDSDIGENRIVDGASHFVFVERPDAVIAAFNEIVAAARTSGRTALAQYLEPESRSRRPAKMSCGLDARF